MGNKSSSSSTNNDDVSSSSSKNSSSSSTSLPNPSSSSSSSPLSYYSLVKNSYQSLVHAIIRPPRASYDLIQLGPEKFLFCEKYYIRKDFQLLNEKNLKLECSIWDLGMLIYIFHSLYF